MKNFTLKQLLQKISEDHITYYTDKLESLRDIFGSKEISLKSNRLVVDDRVYPILDDVIILLDPSQYPSTLKNRIKLTGGKSPSELPDFSEDIQFTFGEEWRKFPDILPEYEQEFLQYFNLVTLADLKNKRVCDLGCGIGRWSYFLTDKCRELVLVDFSEAIFLAQRNLKGADNAIFIMGDLKRLPFRNGFSDFVCCLGVLHHLPTDALDEVRSLRKYAKSILVYLYYALDKRPFYFRGLLSLVTMLRAVVSKIRNPLFRSSFTWSVAVLLYIPLVGLGRALKPVGLAQYVPLYEGYSGKSFQRIRQDVYDRFFTRIEQRFSKKQILGLEDTFSKIVVSDQLPYWHFICDE